MQCWSSCQYEILQDPSTNQYPYPPLFQKLAAGSQQCYNNARTDISPTHYYLSLSITFSLVTTNSVKLRSLIIKYLLLMYLYNIIGVEGFFAKLSQVLPN